MRRIATNEELEILRVNGLMAIQEGQDIPIIVTDEPADLIEGLENDNEREIMRYLLLSPASYKPPMRDKGKLLEKLDLTEQDNEWCKDDITIVYEVVRDNKINTISSSILMSPITNEVIESLHKAEDLVEVQRDLTELISNLNTEGDLIFGSIQNTEPLYKDMDDDLDMSQKEIKETEEECKNISTEI